MKNVREHLKLAFTLFLVAHGIAFALFRTLTPAFWSTGIAGGCALILLCAFRLAKLRAEQAPGLRREEQIKLLSLETARTEARKFLGDENLFDVRLRQHANPLPLELPSHAAEFFALYESVSLVGYEFSLSLEHVGPSEYMSGFWRIGIDSDFVEIVVQTEKDGVYAVDGSEDTPERLAANWWPSIYHCILWEVSLPMTDHPLFSGQNQP